MTEDKYELYDYFYLEKMWNVVRSIHEFNYFNNNKKSPCIPTWYSVINEINNMSIRKNKPRLKTPHGIKDTVELSDREKNVFLKYLKNKKITIHFKPIKYTYSDKDFFTAYSMLKKESHKEIIINLLDISLEKEIENNFNFARNLQVTLDAFDITQAELDKEVNLEHAVAKLLNKGTRDVKKNAPIIIDKLNYLILQKISNSKDVVFPKDGYTDDMFSQKAMNDALNDVCEDELAIDKFYEEYPFKNEDLQKGRITYDYTSKELTEKYLRLELDTQCEKFKTLKTAEKKMIYNLIYELKYYEYKYTLQNLHFNFKKGLPNEVTNSLRESDSYTTPNEVALQYMCDLISKNIPSDEKESD